MGEARSSRLPLKQRPLGIYIRKKSLLCELEVDSIGVGGAGSVSDDVGPDPDGDRGERMPAMPMGRREGVQFSPPSFGPRQADQKAAGQGFVGCRTLGSLRPGNLAQYESHTLSSRLERSRVWLLPLWRRFQPCEISVTWYSVTVSTGVFAPPAS